MLCRLLLCCYHDHDHDHDHHYHYHYRYHYLYHYLYLYLYHYHYHYHYHYLYHDTATSTLAPTSAAQPPVMCTTPEPAKSMTPPRMASSFCIERQPWASHTQCATTG